MNRPMMLVAALAALALAACTTSPAPRLTPTSSASPVVLGEITGDAPANSALILSGEGSGPSAQTPAVLPSGTTRVVFRAVCTSGPFSLTSGGRLVFRGECDPRARFEAQAPVDRLRDRALSWTVPAGTSWRVAAWVIGGAP
jgi:hypothetical protein